MLNVLDIIFFCVHCLLIFFNLVAPFIQRLRKLSIITQAVTFLSWFGIGLVYGIGYCPLTDWHWQIKLKLGETNLPNSFVKYIVDMVLSINSDAVFIDWLTMGLFFLAIAFNIFFYLREKRGI